MTDRNRRNRGARCDAGARSRAASRGNHVDLLRHRPILAHVADATVARLPLAGSLQAKYNVACSGRRRYIANGMFRFRCTSTRVRNRPTFTPYVDYQDQAKPQPSSGSSLSSYAGTAGSLVPSCDGCGSSFRISSNFS